LRIMNRTTTVLVALVAAAGLSTMAYTIPEQRALAWGSWDGFGGGCGFGFGGCGGYFGFIHKHIIQTISQTNTCLNPATHTPIPPPPPPPPPSPPSPSKTGALGGTGGSGGAAGSGGEGGQGGKDAAYMSSTKADVNQKANGGNSNGGHAGNANGGDAGVGNTNGGDASTGNTNGGDASTGNTNGGDPSSQGNGDGHDQKEKQTICINTAVNHARSGFLSVPN
jgi:hypothetical protein